LGVFEHYCFFICFFGFNSEFLIEVTEKFTLHPDYQGKGIGSQVLKKMLEQEHVNGKRVTLNVLQGSSARRLYERFGFKVESEDPIDVYMFMRVVGNHKTDESF
jgi:GNAT superfamily N-acetyltransferase